MKLVPGQPSVYVVEMESGGEAWFKIGQSLHALARVSALQTGCPVRYSKLFVADVANAAEMDLVEASMHMVLLDRHHSGEWFNGAVDDGTLLSLGLAAHMVGVTVQWRAIKVPDEPYERKKSRLLSRFQKARWSYNWHLAKVSDDERALRASKLSAEQIVQVYTKRRRRTFEGGPPTK